MRVLTLEEFIKKAKAIHGNKYDYSKTVYIDAKTKIIVICPVHGEFFISPSNHLSGKNCPKCRNDKFKIKYSMSLEEFIKRAKKIHGDRYDYSKTIYNGFNKELCIICLEHGEFKQRASVHLRGSGCPNCSKVFFNLNHPTKLTLEEFIRRAKLVHGDKYDYINLFSKGNKTKIIFICSKHGKNEQRIHHHLNGSGCSGCKTEKITKLKTLTLEEFIRRAKLVHGDKYDYSKAIYVNMYQKIIIICPQHGEFLQTPANHLQGQGCPICKSSKGELQIKQILDRYNLNYTQEYRIPNQKYILYYDFYLPDYNLLMEFHGKQHYDYIPFFHRNGEEDLLKQQERDGFKKALAKELKYKFLEFNYKQLNHLSKEQFELFLISKIKI